MTIRTRSRVLRAVAAVAIGCVLVSLSGCAEDTRDAGDSRGAGDAGRVPETVEGFWFFTYSGQGDAPSGEAFAYVTEDGTRLEGGIASEPLGGPLSGLRDGATFELEIEDVGGAPVVTVEGRFDGVRADGEWTVTQAAGSRGFRGSFKADYFEPGEIAPDENPFVGEWNNFDDGGVTTLIFDENFRFTGSEADLDFTGQYAFDPSRGLVGVYEADGSSVHMEKLTYRFEGSDAVVLNGSVYRRQ